MEVKTDDETVKVYTGESKFWKERLDETVELIKRHEEVLKYQEAIKVMCEAKLEEYKDEE